MLPVSTDLIRRQRDNLLAACEDLLDYVENGDILDHVTADRILAAARAAIEGATDVANESQHSRQ